MRELLVRLDENLLCRPLLDNPALRVTLPVPLVGERPPALELNARLTEMLSRPSPWADRLSAAMDRVFVRAVDESTRLDTAIPGGADDHAVVEWFDAFAAEAVACLDLRDDDDADEADRVNAAIGVADRFAAAPSLIAVARER